MKERENWSWQRKKKKITTATKPDNNVYKCMAEHTLTAEGVKWILSSN